MFKRLLSYDAKFKRLKFKRLKLFNCRYKDFMKDCPDGILRQEVSACDVLIEINNNRM